MYGRRRGFGKAGATAFAKDLEGRFTSTDLDVKQQAIIDIASVVNEVRRGQAYAEGGLKMGCLPWVTPYIDGWTEAKTLKTSIQDYLLNKSFHRTAGPLHEILDSIQYRSFLEEADRLIPAPMKAQANEFLNPTRIFLNPTPRIGRGGSEHFSTVAEDPSIVR
jgi:hypothetical protein